MNTPQTMLALVQRSAGFAEDVRSLVPESLEPYVDAATVETPHPGSGQVLIRMSLAPVNPSDIAFIMGVYGQPRIAGAPAGFEGVGEVVASGGGFLADRLVGRRVSCFAGISGTWAEYAVAQARACIPLRKDIPDEDGAALLVNPFSAWALRDLIRAGGTKAFVMTAGASQLGKLLVPLAAGSGLRPISLVRRAEQVDPLLRLGAAHVLNTEDAGFADALRVTLKAERPRILLDALANDLACTVFGAMGPRSRWIVYGGLGYASLEMPQPGQFIFASKQIEGFWLTRWIQDGGVVRMARASRGVQARFASGSWTTDVAARVPLSEAHDRVPGLLAGPNRGKVLLEASNPSSG